VVAVSGSRIAVYGASSAAVGETAYQHGILLHQLADETAGTAVPAEEPGRIAGPGARLPTGRQPPRRPPGTPGRPGPRRPLRYELRRWFGVRTPWMIAAAALLGSVFSALLMTRNGSAPASGLRLISGWATQLPLPVAAVGAGALGALSYGQEFRYRALATGYGPEPRTSRLLIAKLATSGGAALLLAALAAAADAAALRLTLGHGRSPDPVAASAATAGWATLAVGCAWAGVLAAGMFRTTALGLAAVLSVPLLAVPAVQALLGGKAVWQVLDAADALWSVLTGAPHRGGMVSGALRFAGQPVFIALALLLVSLGGAYTASALRGRWRRRRPTRVHSSRTAPLTSKKG
jgi:hypothetical protein